MFRSGKSSKESESNKEMKQDKKIKILLVEDEAITALAMVGALQSMGYETCHPVATGEKALLSLEQDAPDVVLMDINLTGDMDGIETAGRMMLSGHRAIIFITGYSCGEVYERAKALDPVAIFTKPVKPLDLKKAIDTAVFSDC
jgi:CheY-like chemotaxis protein